MAELLVALFIIYVIGVIVFSIGAFDTLRFSESMWDDFDPQEKIAIISVWPLALAYFACLGFYKLTKRLGDK